MQTWFESWATLLRQQAKTMLRFCHSCSWETWTSVCRLSSTQIDFQRPLSSPGSHTFFKWFCNKNTYKDQCKTLFTEISSCTVCPIRYPHYWDLRNCTAKLKYTNWFDDLRLKNLWVQLFIIHCSRKTVFGKNFLILPPFFYHPQKKTLNMKFIGYCMYPFLVVLEVKVCVFNENGEFIDRIVFTNTLMIYYICFFIFCSFFPF